MRNRGDIEAVINAVTEDITWTLPARLRLPDAEWSASRSANSSLKR